MSVAPTDPVPNARRRIGKPKSTKLRDLLEGGVMTSLVLCGLFSILTTVGIVGTLFTDTVEFFSVKQVVAHAEDMPGKFESSGNASSFVVGQQEDGTKFRFLTHTSAEAAAIHSDEMLRPVIIIEDPEVRLIPRDPASKAPTIVLPVESYTIDRLTLKGTPPADVSSYRIELFHSPARVADFLTGGEWNPKLGSTPHFGIWPLISGTLMVTLIAMLVAGPLGLITAIWLAEYAPKRVRDVLKPVLEILAGVPTVVLGFFALTVITPQLRFEQFPMSLLSGILGVNPFNIGTYNVLSAGIAVGILTLPIITSLTEDALRAVPRALREGSFGLGATRFETSIKVTTPAALSGIIAAFLLAIARCVGETMIVALAAGQQPIDLAGAGASALDPRGGMQPMTGYLVAVIGGDISNFGIEYFSLYAVAAVLFVITFALTIVGHIIRVKFQQQYE